MPCWLRARPAADAVHVGGDANLQAHAPRDDGEQEDVEKLVNKMDNSKSGALDFSEYMDLLIDKMVTGDTLIIALDIAICSFVLSLRLVIVHTTMTKRIIIFVCAERERHT